MKNLPIAERKIAIVEAIQAKTALITDDKRQFKYARMAESPHAFYRGTNHLFWRDWGGDDRLNRFSHPLTRTWLAGDAHLYNFGTFDNRRGEVVYDVNDFDDAIIADYQYDVWRAATSLLLLCREQNLPLLAQDNLLQTFVQAYLDGVVTTPSSEGISYFTKENSYGRLDDFIEEVEGNHSPKKLLKGWTKKLGKTYRFDLALPKLGEISGERRVEITTALTEATLFFDVPVVHLLDVAERLWAGNGSCGLSRYYVLVEAIHPNGDTTHHLLDIKHQIRPTPYNYLQPEEQADYNERFINHAQRHLMACRAVSLLNDMFLGWITLHDGYYSIVERSPYKAAFPTTSLNRPTRFLKMTQQWGTILAMLHTRSEAFGDALRHQVATLTNPYRPEFMALMREVAFSYADQVAADYRYFREFLGS